MEWTLETILKRFNNCVAKKMPRKGKEFDDFDTLSLEEQNQLLLATANQFFSNGRYSVVTEWTIEMFCEKGVDNVLFDLKQINSLTPQLRKRLTFFRQFKTLCFPLFRKQPLDLTQQPFSFKQGDYTIANHELRDFLYNTDNLFLAYVIIEGLVEQMAGPKETTSPVAYNELHNDVFYMNYKNGDSVEEMHEKKDKLVETLLDANNHYELGRRLGLSYMAQCIYDMTDLYICRYYDYEQVDFAKELAVVIEEGLKRYDNLLNEQFAKEITEAVDTLAEKYNVVFADKRHTLNYIFLDLLSFAQPEITYESDDDDLDFED